jgi:cell division protein FtsI (penicillin-binding protein 3)
VRRTVPIANPSIRPACPPRRADRPPHIPARLIALVVVLILGFTALLVRLVEVQGVSSERYAVLGDYQRLTRIELPAPRGALLDRNGAQLAVSIERPTVYADPQLVTDPAGAARALAPLLGLEERDLRERLTANANFVYLARWVDDATAEAVRALRIDGVALRHEPTRVSPAGDIAASVLGQVGAENVGLSGLEEQYEKVLSGTPGHQLIEQDPSGRDIPGGVRESRPPVAGHSLVLTLDRDLQYVTEQALAQQIVASKARSGIAVVMDPRSGEVLAMANVVAGAKDRPPEPAGYNKALVDVYEPGSVNKVVTLSAAVEERAVGPRETFAVPDRITVAGTTFYDSEPHPVRQWSPVDIMAESSNAGAIMIAQRLGPPALDRYVESFGLAGDTGLDFPGEASALMPELSEWSGTTLPTVAIGYGVAVTPLHMLGVFNTIANDGVYVVPSLVRSEIDARGKARLRPAPAQRRVVSSETAAEVTAMLTEVVRSGTGEPAAVSGYSVAGKTGTARKVEGGGYKPDAYIASFAGFFPAEAPRLSAIVVLDEPQPYYGGLASGPVFSQIASYAARHYQIPPGGSPGPRELEERAATLAPSSATRP